MVRILKILFIVIFFAAYRTDAQTYNLSSYEGSIDFHNLVGTAGSSTNVVTVDVPAPAEQATTNDQNIALALEKARQIHTKNPSKIVVILFKKGQYLINKTIHLSYGAKDGYTIIKGSGNATEGSLTRLILNSATERFLIQITGSNSYHVADNVKYNKSDNSLSFKSGTERLKGKILDITLTNGRWATGKLASKQGFLGQINRAIKIVQNKVYLERSFRVTSSFLDGTNRIKIAAFFPISNVGIENILLTHSGRLRSNTSLAKFDGSYNCWMKDVICLRPSASHMSVERSYKVQIRNNVFIDSYLHGGNGQGYGVALGGKSTSCLVEGNLFYRLRHAVVLSSAANYNIISYNVSSNQYSTDNNGRNLQGLGDMSLHGYLPYANLIEGNAFDLIRADGYWGKNGPFNVFYKNKVKKNMQFDNIDYAITKSNTANGGGASDKNLGLLSSKGTGSMYLSSGTAAAVNFGTLNKILNIYK